ncbi:MAG: archease [Candidatus Binatia bacterium]
MSDRTGAFQEIEHTADRGIELTAATLPDLFSLAGTALYKMIVDPSEIDPKNRIAVSVTGNGREELLHDWLCELLAEFNLKAFLGSQCEVTKVDPNQVKGWVKGETLDRKRHQLRTEIKGVTYHDLKVWEAHGTWHARIIFDV